MNRYRGDLIRYALGLAVFGVLACTHGFRTFVFANVAVQVLLFVVVAAIPAYRTGRMSYVDIAWPWGLVAIGVLTAFPGTGYQTRTLIVAASYLVMGLRMGLPALPYLARHRGLPVEFARYRYQRLRWQEAGHGGENLPMQLEIFLQCLANVSVLAAPAVVLATATHAPLSALEIGGFGGWALCWTLEWLTDHQKRRFAATASSRTSTCDAGLWRYSRHPNYFFQWMGWNALAFAAAPSLVELWGRQSPLLWAMTVAAVAGASGFMYWTLVEFTGIRPSEHYSVRKRPHYAEYQRTTNMFFPGPRRVSVDRS